MNSLTYVSFINLLQAEKTYARIYPYDNNEFSIRFFAEHDGLGFKVHGKKIGVVPYITSLTINSQEYCSKPALVR